MLKFKFKEKYVDIPEQGKTICILQIENRYIFDMMQVFLRDTERETSADNSDRMESVINIPTEFRGYARVAADSGDIYDKGVGRRIARNKAYKNARKYLNKFKTRMCRHAYNISKNLIDSVEMEED